MDMLFLIIIMIIKTIYGSDINSYINENDNNNNNDNDVANSYYIYQPDETYTKNNDEFTVYKDNLNYFDYIINSSIKEIELKQNEEGIFEKVYYCNLALEYVDELIYKTDNNTEIYSYSVLFDNLCNNSRCVCNCNTDNYSVNDNEL